MNDRTIVPQGKIFPSLLRIAKRRERRFGRYFKAVSPREIKLELWDFFIV